MTLMAFSMTLRGYVIIDINHFVRRFRCLYVLINYTKCCLLNPYGYRVCFLVGFFPDLHKFMLSKSLQTKLTTYNDRFVNSLNFFCKSKFVLLLIRSNIQRIASIDTEI